MFAALEAFGTKSPVAAVCGRSATNREKAGSTQWMIKNELPTVPCTRLITSSHRARVLVLSKPVGGNQEGATAGRRPIKAAKTKNPKALPVVIRCPFSRARATGAATPDKSHVYRMIKYFSNCRELIPPQFRTTFTGAIVQSTAPIQTESDRRSPLQRPFPLCRFPTSLASGLLAFVIFQTSPPCGRRMISSTTVFRDRR
jgi:hypothetical protein